uniref:glomulin isoform X1 n=1 Tax=Myxine glutinosa TaxID=7769 RepID=UPI00358F47C8
MCSMQDHGLTAVLQKCVRLPEEEISPEDGDAFVKAVKCCLQHGDSHCVCRAVQDECNEGLLQCAGWNLLAPLVELMTEGISIDSGIEAILNRIIQVCSPKELVFGFFEALACSKMNCICSVIVQLLPYMMKVLHKLDVSKGYSVGLLLSSIMTQLDSVPVPYMPSQRREDPHGLHACLSTLIPALGPLVHEATVNAATAPASVHQRDGSFQASVKHATGNLRRELLKFCERCLGFLLLTSLEPLQEGESEKFPLLEPARVLLLYLDEMGESPQELIQIPHIKKETPQHGGENIGLQKVYGGEVLQESVEVGSVLGNEEIVGPQEEGTFHFGDKTLSSWSTSSLACLTYLMVVHDLVMDKFPAVYSHLYVLRTNAPFIAEMLQRSEEAIVMKGLCLLEVCLHRLELESLTMESFDIAQLMGLSQDLIKLMISCPLEAPRKKGLEVFQLFIDRLNEEGKHILFRYVLHKFTHGGVAGYIIQNINKQADVTLRGPEREGWFCGRRLLLLLKPVLWLAEGAETDLLEHSDRIMAALNHLRFLLIRDNLSENKSGIWKEIHKIENNFLRPIRMALKLSRAHYEAQLNSATRPDRVRCSAIGSRPLKIPVEQEVQVLQSALNLFDLLESMLARVEEIIEGD